jgi:hypothetical protein
VTLFQFVYFTVADSKLSFWFFLFMARNG